MKHMPSPSENPGAIASPTSETVCYLFRHLSGLYFMSRNTPCLLSCMQSLFFFVCFWDGASLRLHATFFNESI